MPYIGDSITNPVALTLTGGAATGTVSGPADTERHVCWFSLPAQAAGNSILIEPLLGGLFHGDVELCMLWDGGNVAYLSNVNGSGDPAGPGVYWAVPAGAAIRIGVLPRGSSGRPSSDTSVSQANPIALAKTLAEWETAFGSDLTKRLHPGVSIQVTVAATASVPGAAGNPAEMDFTVSPAAQTFALDTWVRPTFEIEATVPAGSALRISQDGGGAPALVGAGSSSVFQHRGELYITAPGGSVVTISPTPEHPMPTLAITIEAVAVSAVIGTATDTNGITPEPCNALMFHVLDALRAVEAPSGTFNFPTVPAGDYILVTFSREDARDIVGTNLSIPQAERAVGGGYVFIPLPPET
jgi:hypothetical protein